MSDGAPAGNAGTNLGQAHWGVASQAMNTGTNFLLSVLVARSVEPAVFGQFSLVLVVYIVAIGLLRAAGTNVLTVGHGTDPDALRARARDCVGFAAGCGVLLGTGCLVTALWVDGPVRPVLLVLAAAFPLLLVQDAVRGIYFARTRPRSVALADGVWAVVQVGATAAVVVADPTPSPVALTAAWATGGALSAVVALAATGIRPAVHPPHQWLRAHRRLAAPLVGTFALTALPLYSTFLVMPLVATIADVGVLRAAYLFYGPLGTLYAAAFALTLVDAVRAASPDATARLCARVSTLLGGLAVAWGAVVVLLPESVGRWILGPIWEDTAATRVLLACCLVAEGVVVGANAALAALRRTERAVAVQVVTAPMTLLLALALAAGGGAGGAAAGLALGNVVAAIALWARVPGAVRSRTTPADSRRLRLVFIVTSHMTAVRFLQGVLARFGRSGWDVTVICGPGDGLDRLSALDGVGVGVLPMRRDPSARADLVSLHRLRAEIRAIGPDAVVTATPKAGLLGTLAARSTRVPVVVHLMWGLRSETLDGPARRMVQGLESVATRLSHRVVPCSRSLERELLERRMVRPARTGVLGGGSSHGVDLEHLTPPGPVPTPRERELRVRLDALGDGPVIGFVGRLNRDKGVDHLLRAVADLAADGLPSRLMVVGEPEDLAVVEQVLGARDRGLPVLWLEQETDMRSVYAVMDIHCLPTLREGMPNVCLEASACAVPTVTTDATGAVDTVLPGVTGYIARRADPSSLADALRLVLADTDHRRRLGAAARAWMERDFAASIVEQRYEDLLRRLVTGQRTRRTHLPSLRENRDSETDHHTQRAEAGTGSAEGGTPWT